MKAVNASITYSDNEGNTVIFRDPQVTVECAVVVVPEECPKPVEELGLSGCYQSSRLWKDSF